MLQPFPPTIYATEGYAPNLPIARKKLEPLGVTVVAVIDDTALPFQDGQFDFIMNQHEPYSASEVNRILSPNGTFLTQQVGGLDCAELNEQFNAPLNNEFASWSLEAACNELQENGFTILEAKETFPFQRFYDVGAIVYYLKAIPWQIPDFTVERYYEELYRIHKVILQKGYFDVTQHRFLIKAIRSLIMEHMKKRWIYHLFFIFTQYFLQLNTSFHSNSLCHQHKPFLFYSCYRLLI